MFTVVSDNLKIIFLNMKYTIKTKMTFKLNFFLTILGQGFNALGFVFLWYFLAYRMQILGKNGKEELMLLQAVSGLHYLFLYLFFADVGSLAREIINGSIDKYLVRPKSVLFSIISGTNISLIGNGIVGILTFFVFIKISFKNVFLFLFLSFLGSIMALSLKIIMGSLVLYVKGLRSISSTYSGVIDTLLMYPEAMYKGIGKIMVYTIFPAAFITYIPVKLILEFDKMLLFKMITVVIVTFVFAVVFFYRGLKNYESGNLM